MLLTVLLAASTPAPATPPQAATPPPAREQRVCRNVQQTGTRLGSRRVCRTVSEQRQADEENQIQTREMQAESGGMVDLTGPGQN